MEAFGQHIQVVWTGEQADVIMWQLQKVGIYACKPVAYWSEMNILKSL